MVITVTRWIIKKWPKPWNLKLPWFSSLQSVDENLHLSFELFFPLLSLLLSNFQSLQVLTDLSKFFLKVDNLVFTWKPLVVLESWTILVIRCSIIIFCKMVRLFWLINHQSTWFCSFFSPLEISFNLKMNFCLIFNLLLKCPVKKGF